MAGAVTHFAKPNLPLPRCKNLDQQKGAAIASATVRARGDGFDVSLNHAAPDKEAPAPAMASLDVHMGLRILATEADA